MTGSKIAVDCDGVIAAVHQLIDDAWADAALPCRHDPNVWCFDYEECVGKEAKKIAHSVFARPHLYDEPLFPLIYGAEEGLAKLRAQPGVRVMAVSAPFAEHAGSKWKFLRRMGFGRNDIFLTKSKNDVCWDTLIDDRAETITKIPPGRTGILFTQPWNKSLRVLPPNVVRVDSWAELTDLLCAYD